MSHKPLILIGGGGHCKNEYNSFMIYIKVMKKNTILNLYKRGLNNINNFCY